MEFPFFSIAGITLALFGGVRKHTKDRNKVPVRGDIHVIVVGMFKLFLDGTKSGQLFYLLKMTMKTIPHQKILIN